MGIPTSFVWIIILFNEAFKYGESAKFLDYVGASPEPLFVEFCSFVQCHIVVNLTFARSE
jgi:hypothetical protein